MMKTEIIKIRDYESLPSFVPQKSVVAGGGIVAFPTETVYGIAVAYDSDQAIESIFRLKERERGKPLTLHISNASCVDAFVDWTRLSDEEIRIYRSLIAKFWPGPLTVILPKKNTVSDVLTGGLSTVAFRFPSHPVSIAFIEACGGAVAGTSANLSGGFSCTTGAAVEQELGGKIACILDADSGILGIESTVISIQGGVKILRQGAIGIRMIERVLRGSVQRSESGKGVHRNDAGTAKSKIRFYEPEEVTRVFEHVVQNPNVAAVLFRDSMFYNITPILKEKDIKTRVRILTKDSFIGKFYKVLRDLDAETIERIYLPKMDGEGVEAAIRGLLG